MDSLGITRQYFDDGDIARLSINSTHISIGDVSFRVQSDKLVPESYPQDEFLLDQKRQLSPEQFTWEVVAYVKVHILRDGTKIQQLARTGELYNEDYFTKRGGGGPYTGYPHKYDGEDIGQRFSGLADQLVEQFHPKRVLDVGCATGILVRELQKRGVTAEGVDISEWAVANAVTSGVRRASLLSLPFSDDHFDLIVSQDVMEHIHPDDLTTALGEQIRITGTGGVICHFVPFYPQFSEPVQIDCHLTNANQEWWTQFFSTTQNATLEHIPAPGPQWIDSVVPLDNYYFLRVQKAQRSIV